MMDLQNDTSRRWITAALVGTALLSAGYWGEALLMKLRSGPGSARTVANPAVNADTAVAMPSTQTVASLLGARPAQQAVPATPADRFKVFGVIARASGRGLALVAVDGQAPRTFSVGSELAPGFVLEAVSSSALTLTGTWGGAVLATLPLPEPGQAAPPTGSGDAAFGDRFGTAPAGGVRSNPRAVEPVLTTPVPVGPAPAPAP